MADQPTSPATRERTRRVEATPGLLCFWNFQEPAGPDFRALGAYEYELSVQDGPVTREDSGIFGPQSLRLGQTPAWLSAPRDGVPALDLQGPGASLTLLAWLRRHPGPPGCQAVAGMWNEHGLRQYCLFLNLGIWDSAEQVGAHFSATGGATPGYKYCMEAAIGATAVDFTGWHCAAITYEAETATAWLDGQLDSRPGRNPLPLPGGIFQAGPDGADFTVGAVARPDWVDEQRMPHGHVIANRFHGLLGGLAVFDRALSPAQILALSFREPVSRGKIRPFS